MEYCPPQETSSLSTEGENIRESLCVASFNERSDDFKYRTKPHTDEIAPEPWLPENTPNDRSYRRWRYSESHKVPEILHVLSNIDQGHGICVSSRDESWYREPWLQVESIVEW